MNELSSDDTTMWWQLYVATGKSADQLVRAHQGLLAAIEKLDPAAQMSLVASLEKLRDALMTSNDDFIPPARDYGPDLADQARRPDPESFLYALEKVDLSHPGEFFNAEGKKFKAFRATEDFQ